MFFAFMFVCIDVFLHLCLYAFMLLFIYVIIHLCCYVLMLLCIVVVYCCCVLLLLYQAAILYFFLLLLSWCCFIVAVVVMLSNFPHKLSLLMYCLVYSTKSSRLISWSNKLGALKFFVKRKQERAMGGGHGCSVTPLIYKVIGLIPPSVGEEM